VAICSSIFRPSILSFTARATPLIIVEQNAFVAELFSEHSILCSKVLDHVLLLMVNPTSEDQE
jgi:hypothetical protein